MPVKDENVTTDTEARPTDGRMASRRELPPHVTAYIAHLIREWEAAHPRSLHRLALKVRVSRAQLINVRDGDRGAGNRLETAMAALFHGGSVDALREAAANFRGGAAKAPAPPRAAPEPAVSELRQALTFLRDTYPPAFLAYAEAKAPAAIDDGRTRLEWLDWIRSLHGPWSRRQGESRPPSVPPKRKSRSA